MLSVFLRFANAAAENDEDYRSGIEIIRNPVASSPAKFVLFPIQFLSSESNFRARIELCMHIPRNGINTKLHIYNTKPIILTSLYFILLLYRFPIIRRFCFILRHFRIVARSKWFSIRFEHRVKTLTTMRIQNSAI